MSDVAAPVVAPPVDSVQMRMQDLKRSIQLVLPQKNNQIAALTRDVQTRDDRIAELTAEMQQRAADLAVVEQQYDQQIAGLTVNLEKVTGKMQRYKHARDMLQRDVTSQDEVAARTAKDGKHRKNGDSSAEVAALRAKVESLKTSYDRVLGEKTASAAAYNTQYTSMIDRHKSEVAVQCQAEIRLRSERNGLKRDMAEVSSLQEQVSSSLADISSLQAQRTTLQMHIAQLQDASRQKDALILTLEKRAARPSVYMTHDIEKELSNLRAQDEYLKNPARLLQQKKSEARRDLVVEEMSSKIESLTARNIELIDTANDATSKALTLRDENVSLREHEAELTRDIYRMKQAAVRDAQEGEQREAVLARNIAGWKNYVERRRG